MSTPTCSTSCGSGRGAPSGASFGFFIVVPDLEALAALHTQNFPDGTLAYVISEQTLYELSKQSTLPAGPGAVPAGSAWIRGGRFAFVFDGGDPSENGRTNRKDEQSPIDNTKTGIINLGTRTSFQPDPNDGVQADYGTIGGGIGNFVGPGGRVGTIAGGEINEVHSQAGFAAGEGNRVGDETNPSATFAAVALGNSSVAEGNGAVAIGLTADAVADGAACIGPGTASGVRSFSGNESDATGDVSAAFNSADSIGTGSFAANTSGAVGDISAAFNNSSALGFEAFAQNESTASGDDSHSEGTSLASGFASHAEGDNTIASGFTAHSEGGQTQASADFSHAEGQVTTASGIGAHAEGTTTVASGDASHAEGQNNQAIGLFTHAEGAFNIAEALGSHVEGQQNNSVAGDFVTTVGGTGSHVEGTSARGRFFLSHAHGLMASTVQGDAQNTEVSLFGISAAGAPVDLGVGGLPAASFSDAEIVLEDNKVYKFKVELIAHNRNATTDAAATAWAEWDFSFLAFMVGGVATVVGAPAAAPPDNESPATGWTITVAPVGAVVRFTFTGAAGDATAQALAYVHLLELGNPTFV